MLVVKNYTAKIAYRLVIWLLCTFSLLLAKTHIPYEVSVTNIQPHIAMLLQYIIILQYTQTLYYMLSYGIDPYSFTPKLVCIVAMYLLRYNYLILSTSLCSA